MDNNQVEWIWTFVKYIETLWSCPHFITKAPMAAAKNHLHLKSVSFPSVAYVCHPQYLPSYV
jgi:hypothetical protein